MLSQAELETKESRLTTSLVCLPPYQPSWINLFDLGQINTFTLTRQAQDSGLSGCSLLEKNSLTTILQDRQFCSWDSCYSGAHLLVTSTWKGSNVVQIRVAIHHASTIWDLNTRPPWSFLTAAVSVSGRIHRLWNMYTRVCVISQHTRQSSHPMYIPVLSARMAITNEWLFNSTTCRASQKSLFWF